MPTVFSHAIIGLAAGSVFQYSGMVSRSDGPGATVGVPWLEALHAGRIPLEMRFMGLSMLCAALPDADVAGFAVNIPYGHAFGHRGFFHSLSFALILAVFTVVAFFPRAKVFSSDWWLLGCYFFLLTASHGLLDTLTSGGLGIALFAPFDNARYLAPIALFEAAPLDISGLFTPWGFRCIRTELVLIWIPALGAVAWLRRPPVCRTSADGNESSGGRAIS
jgi:inner membrane protein